MMSKDVVGYVAQCGCGVQALTLHHHPEWKCQACNDFAGSPDWQQPEVAVRHTPMTFAMPDPLAAAIQTHVWHTGSSEGIGARVGDQVFKLIGFRTGGSGVFEATWELDKETYSPPTLFTPKPVDDEYPIGQVQI